MNERIRELAYKAGLHNHLWLDISDSDDVLDTVKFAELIVRECIGIVSDAVDHREPASTYVDKIKQHFGVKE